MHAIERSKRLRHCGLRLRILLQRRTEQEGVVHAQRPECGQCVERFGERVRAAAAELLAGEVEPCQPRLAGEAASVLLCLQRPLHVRRLPQHKLLQLRQHL